MFLEVGTACYIFLFHTFYESTIVEQSGAMRCKACQVRAIEDDLFRILFIFISFDILHQFHVSFILINIVMMHQFRI